MKMRIFLLLALSSLLFSMIKPEWQAGAKERDPDPQQDFRQRLERLAKLSPDACLSSPEELKDWDPSDSEYRLFSRGADVVVQALNATNANEASAKQRASEALEKLEKMSNEINAAWPEDSRFHFEVLDISPALAIKMTIRSTATYFVFGVPRGDDSTSANLRWQLIGSDDVSFERDSARALVELFALHRGPSGNARFLARITPFGCAGSVGVVFDAREWNPEGFGSLEQIIHQRGAFGLSDQVEGFEQIGHLKTEGELIALPFCEFSSIDTWDNPSLCAEDTYDISGDDVKFVSRIYNRPDLLPVAKAIEYAQRRDFAALLGYCASPEIADRLVREMPPDFFAGEIQVNATGKGSERVELGDGPSYWFEVEERQVGWVLTDFGESESEDSSPESDAVGRAEPLLILTAYRRCCQ